MKNIQIDITNKSANDYTISGSLNSYTCTFSGMPESWTLLRKYAVFIQGIKKYTIELTGNTVIVPAEILASLHSFYVGLFATSIDENSPYRETIEPIHIDIKAGSYYPDGVSPDAPTLNVFENYIAEMEATRDSFVPAEIGRASAENERVSAESGRQSQEQERNDAESIRLSAEVLRNNSESERTESETNRENSEIERASSELARIASESERIVSETARTSAEQIRNSSEADRQSAETLRMSAEAERTSSENIRNDVELIRQSAEATRNLSESERVSSEALRTSAETARVSAETNRETLMADFLSGADERFLPTDEITGETVTTEFAVNSPLIDLNIFGNSVQDGTPTPDNPVEIQSVGDLVTDTEDVNYGKYKIPINMTVGENTTTTYIYINEPLRKYKAYIDKLDFKNKQIIRNVWSLNFKSTDIKRINPYITNLDAFQTYDTPSTFKAFTETWSGNGSCNYFLVNQGASAPHKANHFSISNDGLTFYFCLEKNLMTLAEFKTMIDTWNASNSPLEVVYRLNTPIIENIECEIPEITDATTTISIGTTLAPSSISANYYQNTSDVINQLRNTIISLGGNV